MKGSRGRFRSAWVAWAAGALAFVALARGLPAETFFVGDPGVKLIAARQSHPDRPLEIPLPTIGPERVTYVEPFFAVHGDHSHAVTSELFPLLSSPFIALLGIRGAYVLPALGFFLYLAACARLATALNSGRSEVSVVLTATLGTPLLFYGFEFWEHAPAVGIATLATLWLVGATRENNSNALVAGFLYGLAILLRPEAICFVVAVVAASRLLPAPSTLSVRTVAQAVLGVLLTVLPLWVYSLVHFGAIVPPHIGSHSALLSEGWFATRSALLARWFVPDSLAVGEFWGLALLAWLALGWLSAKSLRDSRAFLVAVALIDSALVVITAPNDGGGQWGPRYLLFAFAPAALVAAGFFEAAARGRSVRIMSAVLAVVVGMWAQRDGYRELRGAKRTYGRVLDFVRLEVPTGGYAVTDLWWLDQVAAAAADERQILFAAAPGDAQDVSRRLAGIGVDRMTFIRSKVESPDTVAWPVDICFRETGRREIPERSLVAIQYRRTCS